MNNSDVMIWDVWIRIGTEFERFGSVLSDEVSKIELKLASMRCGTTLIIF